MKIPSMQAVEFKAEAAQRDAAARGRKSFRGALAKTQVNA
jgi:hypothetical protein